MARQKGIIKLKGSIGDITFYKTKDGYLAREKGGIDKERFLNDPKFQRTRENAAEFGNAGKASRILSTSMRPVMKNIKDSRMTSRLVKAMMTVVKSDGVSDRGERNVIDGDLGLLSGFDFNLRGPLAGTLYAPWVANVDRTLGVLEVTVDGLIPSSQLIAPRGTTHYRFISAGMEVDFSTEEFHMAQSESTVLPYDNSISGAVVLSNSIGVVGSTKPLLGIEFLQDVNGSTYSLNNGTFNSLNLIAVDI